MSSANAAIGIVGVQGPILEFWAAEIPKGRGENAFASESMLGTDHPAFALQMLISSNNYDNALAMAVSEENVSDVNWQAAKAEEIIKRMDLVGTVPLLMPTDRYFDAIDRGAGDGGEDFFLENCPRALYRIEVDDPAWLRHFKAGQSFGTTAFSPFAPTRRELQRSLVTGTKWAEVDALLDEFPDQERAHVVRNREAQPKWFAPGYFGDDGFQALPTCNWIREFFLECGGAEFVYLNHHAPRFNPKSYPFSATKKGLDAKLAKMRVKEHPAGPFGFVLADHGTVTCTDGVRRFKFDALAPDRRAAYVDLESPQVHLGDGLNNDVERESMSLEDYLRTRVESCRSHIEELIAD